MRAYERYRPMKEVRFWVWAALWFVFCVLVIVGAMDIGNNSLPRECWHGRYVDSDFHPCQEQPTERIEDRHG
jgi:hypothetical protein